jgi:hypothetical protein
MRRKLRSHLSYANLVASLALFIALGGTSYNGSNVAADTAFMVAAFC